MVGINLEGEGMEEKETNLGTMSCTLLYCAEFLSLNTMASPPCLYWPCTNLGTLSFTLLCPFTPSPPSPAPG